MQILQLARLGSINVAVERAFHFAGRITHGVERSRFELV
jgi:hypothetical protein